MPINLVDVCEVVLLTCSVCIQCNRSALRKPAVYHRCCQTLSSVSTHSGLSHRRPYLLWCR